MKKHKKLVTSLIVAAICVLILFFGWYAWHQAVKSSSTRQTDMSENRQTGENPNAGEEFKIMKGDMKKIVDLEVVVKDFINNPCPWNADCLWSGVGIDFELSRDGFDAKEIRFQGPITETSAEMEALGYKLRLS